MLNGHITLHRKKDIPLYFLGSQEQIETLERLFPNVQSLLTEFRYPESLKEKENSSISKMPL